jgi:hypothetical protein
MNMLDLLDDASDTATQQEIKYDPVPTKFGKLDDWIQSSNTKCCHCHLFYDDRPVPNPVSVLSSSGEYHIEGMCCSFPCASGYIAKNALDKDDLNKRQRMLREIFFKFTNKRALFIKQPESPTKMVPYGGDIPELTYKAMVRDNNSMVIYE